MAQELIPPNRNFSDMLARAQAARRVEGPAASAAAESVHAPSPRAPLNRTPDADSLNRLLERALAALSRGVVWARGAIVNIVV